MRSLVVLLIAVGWVAWAGPAGADDFVRVENGRFMVGARRFAFVGANLATMHGEPYRARFEETLEAARKDGLTVGRIWALGEGAADASEWQRQNELFRVAPDQFVEAAFVQLDRVLAAAHARGLKLIITLSNYWGDYGGLPAYLRWAGLPESGWGARDKFFSDEKTRAFFRAHLQRIVERVNSVTGVRYADDPTIFAWELMNESRVETDEGDRARRAWIVEMAEFLRSHDSRHLITPGVLGYGTRKERAEWAAVCELAEVDYCDTHVYPQTTDEVPSLRELEQLIDDRVQLARYVARKPIVFGEFGFDTRVDAWLGRARAAWFGDFLQRVFLDGADGALVWIYQPWTGTARDFGIYVDRGDTDDVRAVLQKIAARVGTAPPDSKNPRLGAEHGSALLYDPFRVVHRPGRARVIDEGQLTAVELAPENFDTGRFERVGSYEGGPLVHAYGAGEGWFEWRFTVPGGDVPSRVIIEARLSSEFPGTQAPPDGTSHVSVRIDGAEVATLDAVPDDGAGRVEKISIGDRALLARLKPGTHHALRFVVEPGPRANGLCVYGTPTGRGDPPVGEALPIRILFDGHRS